MPTRILRFEEVSAITRKKRTAIYAEIKAGTFPKQISLGFRSVGWLESEIEAWIDGRAAQRARSAPPSSGATLGATHAP